MSDKLFTAANYWAGQSKTKFCVVRYGNVVGSRGSVVPYFQRLMREGATELPVTDERMTRFWITLEQGVEFVLRSFQRTQGAEIFVPKIPSMRILDLVQSMGSGIRPKTIGIRPGEKIHELMCPLDSAYLTVEFADHYVIKPTIQYDPDVDYSLNPLAEKGAPTDLGFEYNSGTNAHFLTVDELRTLNSSCSTSPTGAKA
jgi:UDP-N-acetylglucosamine 4,6-dehydratase